MAGAKWKWKWDLERKRKRDTGLGLGLGQTETQTESTVRRAPLLCSMMAPFESAFRAANLL